MVCISNTDKYHVLVKEMKKKLVIFVPFVHINKYAWLAMTFPIHREKGRNLIFLTNASSLFIHDYDILHNVWMHTYHYDDVIMEAIASQITSLASVYSTVWFGADQRKHQSSASLAFVWGIHRGPVNSPHKWPVTRKMFPFDDVIMTYTYFMSSDKITTIVSPWHNM